MPTEPDAINGPAERVYVGLGANLGDVQATFGRARAALDALPGTRVVRLSSLYKTTPVDATGPDYLNAVAELATTLEPVPLLRELLSIERAQGRERPFHHAPRTLDLDLLLYGQRQVHTDELTVPHPRLHLRGFVLQPLLELDSALAHPALGPLAPWSEQTGADGVRKLG